MLHDLNYPGIRDTLRLISTPYAWLFMNKNLRCGADRVRIVNGPRSFAILRRPSCHFVQRTPDTIMQHIDIVGPLSSSHGFTCILTCMNPFPDGPKLNLYYTDSRRQWHWTLTVISILFLARLKLAFFHTFPQCPPATHPRPKQCPSDVSPRVLGSPPNSTGGNPLTGCAIEAACRRLWRAIRCSSV